MTDKVLCPWCGAEMKNSTRPYGKNFVSEMECLLCGAKGPAGWGSTNREAEEVARAAALRRFTPPIKPMTLEELMAAYDAREDHVWPYEARPPFLFLDSHIVANDNCWIPWCLVREMVETGYRKYTRESYGKTWRCWERKPTDEERGAAEWG